MKLIAAKKMLLVTVATVFCSLVVHTNAFNLAVMSVDLGSEFIKVAIVKPGVPMEIVLNDESSRKTSTIVAMRDGERLFGSAAENTAVKFPRKAFWYLTQIVGRKYDDPHVDLYRKRFPYYDIIKDEERGTPLFKVDEETTYSPEELIAMVLERAKASAEAYADTPITDCVISIPVFFTQSERKAVLDAAEMVGLKVLQLISDNAAVALNYGVFRRKNFNSTMQYYMFYDAGATSTTATVVGYQMVKTKEGDRVETNPQLVIKGVGFDRTLGGLEMTLRLREHLANLFNSQKKTKTDVFTNERSMGKLFKEANRLKKVLSANSEHAAQVEGLLEDIDFKAVVTREDFEKMNEDLFERVTKPIEDALKASQITLPEITDVILMGGGTRVPKVQSILMSYLGRSELGKSINTDEAAALGAVYQAAHLGKGFKVKKFGVKEACLYPIVVEFEKQKFDDDSAKDAKTVKRTLFGRMNPFPQKKVMTFNKHFKDFSFNVSYGDLAFLDPEDAKSFEQSVLHSHSLEGVDTAYDKHKESAESKGVKAHFRMDENGILHMDKVEFVFEKEGEHKEESAWTKLGDTISGLFGSKDKTENKDQTTDEPAQEGDKSQDSQASKDKPDGSSSDQAKSEETDSDQKKTEKEKSGESKKQNEVPAEEESKEEKKEKEEEKKEEKKDEEPKTAENKTEGTDKENKTAEDKKKDDKPKITVIKEDLATKNKSYDIPDMSAENMKASKKKLADLTAKDKEKKLLEKAKNDLESYVFDMGDKLSQDEYEKCSTEAEREEISKQLAEASDWIYDQEEDAKKEVFKDKLKELKKGTKDLEYRVKELRDRPQALEALTSILNHSTYFLATLKNLSTLEESVFSEVEITTLEKLINETKKWKKDSLAEQKKTPLTEKPKLLVEDVGVKYQALDREVKYLINKAKNFKPKPKPKKDEKKDTNSTVDKNATDSNNETKTTDSDTENSNGDTGDKTDDGPQLDTPQTESGTGDKVDESSAKDSENFEKSETTTKKSEQSTKEESVTHDAEDL